MRRRTVAGLIAVAVITSAGHLSAQAKIGHFNSAAVIKLMPEAQDAQRQLDQLVAEWQKQLGTMQTDWKLKFEEYDKRKLIMTDQRRAETEKELRDLDQRIMDYRNLKFGQNGELFQKQSELMRPVQDMVFKAVKDVAEEEGYDYILDKSGEILMMYASEDLDVTPKILQKLNITPQAARGTPSQRN